MAGLEKYKIKRDFSSTPEPADNSCSPDFLIYPDYRPIFRIPNIKVFRYPERIVIRQGCHFFGIVNFDSTKLNLVFVDGPPVLNTDKSFITALVG